ncbi:MAG: hypothetical protein MZW92_08315 [Comamonadaceae bacterium]|nr:hypothetical protein [Comamonadaceae bacterium]
MPGCIRKVREIHAEVGDVPIHHAFATYRWPDFVGERLRNTVLFVHDVDPGLGAMVASRDFLLGVAGGSRSYVDGPTVYSHPSSPPLIFLRRLSRSMVSSFAVRAPTSIRHLRLAPLQTSSFTPESCSLCPGKAQRPAALLLHEVVVRTSSLRWKRDTSSRFGRRSVQLQVLDSLIDVAERFDLPELLASHQAHDRHVAGAIAEALRMSSGVRSYELREALALAAREGAGSSEHSGDRRGRAAGRLARHAGIRRTAVAAVRRRAGDVPGQGRGEHIRCGFGNRPP